jgi:hypothetical protein
MNNLNTNQYKMAAKVTRSTIKAFGRINLGIMVLAIVKFAP